MEHSPIKILKIFCPKSVNPTLFWKSPIQDKPRNFLHNQRKEWKDCSETYLWRDFVEIWVWNQWVFSENNLGLREDWVRQKEGTQECLKKLSHRPYKTENTRFSRVTYLRKYSRKTHLKHKVFHGNSLVVRQSRESLSEICVFQFSP